MKILTLQICNEINKPGYIGRFWIENDFAGSLEGIYNSDDWQQWKEENPEVLILPSKLWKINEFGKVVKR